jgi:hypothetical protein
MLEPGWKKKGISLRQALDLKLFRRLRTTVTPLFGALFRHLRNVNKNGEVRTYAKTPFLLRKRTERTGVDAG